MTKKMIFISGWGFKANIFDDVAESLCHSRESGNDTALVGWSLGAISALQLYSRSPESFSHLILISSTPRFMRDDNWAGMSDAQAAKQLGFAKIDMQNYQQQFLRLAVYPDKCANSKQIAKSHMYSHDETDLLTQLQTLFYTDMRSEFSRLTIPVMQIIAENDMVVRPEQSMQSTELLNHTIHTIPNAGHMLLKTHTQEVATRIKEFLC